MIRRITLIAIALLGIAWQQSARSQTRYTVRDIGNHSYPFALNNLGDVVGTMVFPGGSQLGSPFLWRHPTLTDPGGTLTDLGGLTGDDYGEARGINDNGQVVWQLASPNGRRAMLYSNGTSTPMPYPLVRFVYGINKAGKVVGEGVPYDGSPFGYAVIYDPSSQSATTLPAFTWIGNTSGCCINELDQVGGSVGAPDPGGFWWTHAALWLNGQPIDVGAPLAYSPVVIGLNNQGEAIGTYGMGFAANGGFIWRDGVLQPCPFTPMGINDQGDVVGWGGSAFVPGHGGLLLRNGQVIDLNTLIDPTLGWAIWQAVAINKSGQILCAGFSLPGQWSVDNQHTLLLTPGDTAPPTVTASASPGPNTFGWNNGDVTVTFTAVDEAGGTGLDHITYSASGAQTIPDTAVPASTTTVLINVEGVTTLTFTATDKAGNTSQPQPLTIRLDKTNPAGTITLSPQRNTSGWNNTDVTVAVNAADNPGGSGIPPDGITCRLSMIYDGQWYQIGYGAYTAPFTLSRERSFAVDITGVDRAGNQFRTVSLIHIDKTPPVTTASVTGPQAANGDYTGPVSVSLSASDAFSGVQAMTYALDGGLQQPYTGAIAIGAAGPHTLTFYSTDVAGNREATQTLQLNIADTVPPVIGSVTVNPGTLWPPDHKMVDVTVSYTCSDNDTSSDKLVCSLSVTSSESDNGLGDGDTPNDIEVIDAHHIRLRAERSGKGSGRTYTITIVCVDAAGNRSTAQATVSVPKSMGK